jgi:hypothetical protein
MVYILNIEQQGFLGLMTTKYVWLARRPNIMEVPRLCKIIVVPKAPSNLIRKVKLAMEIICSQKFT